MVVRQFGLVTVGGEEHIGVKCWQGLKEKFSTVLESVTFNL